ncbi:MAG: hypothetical protein ABIJ96_09955 [Elusimicrobiota bacterium]
MTKTKELQEEIVENMRHWQKIESGSVAMTGTIMSKTDSPVIKLIMEIIQHDSKMHHRIQQLIIDSLQKESISLTPEELGKVWDLIEQHIKMEEETVRLAKESKDALKGRKMMVQEYLLDYLIMDEEKHDKTLETLATIKKGMYPYG